MPTSGTISSMTATFLNRTRVEFSGMQLPLRTSCYKLTLHPYFKTNTLKWNWPHLTFIELFLWSNIGALSGVNRRLFMTPQENLSNTLPSSPRLWGTNRIGSATCFAQLLALHPSQLLVWSSCKWSQLKQFFCTPKKAAEFCTYIPKK